MNKKQYLELRADILREEAIKTLKEIITREIDIRSLETTPPDKIVLNRQLTDKSYKEITAGELLAETRIELLAYEKTLASIEHITNKEEKLDKKARQSSMYKPN